MKALFKKKNMSFIFKIGKKKKIFKLKGPKIRINYYNIQWKRKNIFWSNIDQGSWSRWGQDTW